MRAIDLYAGIGGWSLGLRLAGVDVVASYEWWKPAIKTHMGNHGGEFEATNIRELDLQALPDEIDLVVGSPPCTEFSYANRGGNGNIAEGMKDLVRFFEVVEHLKPKFWAMENVPRVAKVLEAGFADPEHVLYRFRNLQPVVRIVDFSDYGTPQARRRCIATNIPLELVDAYRSQLPKRTLGEVVEALSASKNVTDPVWGITMEAKCLTETEVEPPLNSEELRMNRDGKEFHPVYNNMSFPDRLDRPGRTVTATCTRVSRESIIIADDRKSQSFRRLTIRERASLQGFPITYQFHAKSFAEKAKMIGNAIPPTFPYLLAQAASGVGSDDFIAYSEVGKNLSLPDEKSGVTPPDKEGKTYQMSRRFRAAIPNLRFKSGMRFELSNSGNPVDPAWRVRFFFGSSKDIREIDLDGGLTSELLSNQKIADCMKALATQLSKGRELAMRSDPQSLQKVWAHLSSGVGPYDIVDMLGHIAKELISLLEDSFDDEGDTTIADYIVEVATGASDSTKLVSKRKLEQNALPMLAGLLVGEWFNTLDWSRARKAAA